MGLLDISLLVKEFYAIEAVTAMLTGAGYGDFQLMRHSHNRWYQDFTDFRNEYISKFASAIYDYTALVVAAELRHAMRNASHYIANYYTNSLHRDEVYRDCTTYTPEGILKSGFRIFDPEQVKWSESYGGEKWWNIAKAGLMKGRVSDCIFIDHCVDLSHNNSVYFDKSAGIFYLSEKEKYSDFLDWKRICDPRDLLQEQRGAILNRLIWRADNLNIIRDCYVDNLFFTESDKAEKLLLDYRPVQWGNKHLECSENSILQSDEFYREEKDEREEYERQCRYAKCA